MLFPMISYIDRLSLKAVPVSSIRYINVWAFHKLRCIKWQGNLSFSYLEGPFIKMFQPEPHSSYACVIFELFFCKKNTS